MKKVVKIFALIAILFAFTVNFSVYAEPVDEIEELNDVSLAAADLTSNTTTAPSENKSSTQVTSVKAIEEGKLSISDILNILLIATGIVIIMLAIAIFIKMK